MAKPVGDALIDLFCASMLKYNILYHIACRVLCLKKESSSHEKCHFGNWHADTVIAITFKPNLMNVFDQATTKD